MDHRKDGKDTWTVRKTGKTRGLLWLPKETLLTVCLTGHMLSFISFGTKDRSTDDDDGHNDNAADSDNNDGDDVGDDDQGSRSTEVSHSGQPVPDSTFFSRFTKSVRMMACVICVSHCEASHCIACVTVFASIASLEVVTLSAALSSCTVLPPC